MKGKIMVNSKRMSENADMLDKIYKNLKSGSDSMINAMSHVSGGELRGEMTAQLDGYEKYAGQVSKMIREQGNTPKEEGLISKLSSKLNMNLNTMTDTTDAHIAKVLINEATAGVADMTGIVREFENTSCSEASLRLAREIAAFEENNIKDFKKFL